jgi:hypothetical protein
MKRHVLALFLSAAAGAASATDVGVSVHVNQPGVYGRVDIGRVPAPPVLIYPQPVIYAQPAVVVERRPIYLHVPPGHAKNWGKHCEKYRACGQPVYFVRDDWYQQHYAPQVRYAPPTAHGHKGMGKHKDNRERHGEGRDHGHGPKH